MSVAQDTPKTPQKPRRTKRPTQKPDVDASTIEISVSLLADRVASIVGATSKDTSNPIFEQVLFQMTAEGLELTASSPALSLCTKLPLNGPPPSRFTVHGQTLLKMLKALPRDATVQVEPEANHWVRVRSARTEYRVQGLAGDLFPTIYDGSKLTGHASVPSDALLSALRTVVAAVSKDESRPNLNGVLFESVNGSLRLVATDGHRLAHVQTDIEWSVEHRVLVPRQGILELVKLIDGLDKVSLSVDASTLRAETDATILRIHLLEAQYPDYSQVIPSGHQTVAELDSAEVLAAMRCVVLASPDRGGASFQFGPEEIVFAAQNPQLGEVSVQVAGTVTGPDLVVGFNPTYVRDAVEALGCDRLRVELKDGLSPAILHGPDAGTFYVVMPMRL